MVDPHGDTTGEEKYFYTEKLASNIEKLYEQLESLTEELETSKHQSFSLEIRKNLNATFTELTDYMADTPIQKIQSKWEKLKNRKELKEEKSNLIG